MGTLIGMPEAGRRAGVSATSVRRSLEAAGVPLQRINRRALAVDEAALAAFIAGRAGYRGRGRPAGVKNKGPRPDKGRPRAAPSAGPPPGATVTAAESSVSPALGEA